MSTRGKDTLKMLEQAIIELKMVKLTMFVVEFSQDRL